MTALYLGDAEAARGVAREVLLHAAQAPRDHWSLATEAEAKLYLGEWSDGLDAYAHAIRAHAGPREIASMHEQALVILTRLAPREARGELQEQLMRVFGR